VNLRSQSLARIQLLPFILSELWATVRCLSRHRYDLIQAHWIVPQGFVAWIATRFFRTANVITVHGGDIFGLQGKWLGRAKRIALRGATRVTVNASVTEAAVVALAGDLPSLWRIPMGVSELEPPKPERIAAIRSQFSGDGPIVAFVGRLVPEKGPADAIEAIAILVDRAIDGHLMMIGEGPLRAELEGFARNRGIADRIHFLGWLGSSDVADHLASADMFVGPSRRAPDGWVEAQGLTFAEAMMASIPVIATRSGGISDTVQHEQTGLLVDENAPAQIADAVERLHRDQGLAEKLAANGRKFAREFRSRPASARQFDELFTGLSEQARPIEFARAGK